LEEWRRISKYAAPDDFIFAGRSGNFMDPSNYRKRVLHKLAEQLGLPKLTFQVIRRTIATLAKDKGHVKDIQGMLRHSRVATTTDVYMQTMEDGVRSTVTSIHEELMGTGTTGQHSSKPGSGKESKTFWMGKQHGKEKFYKPPLRRGRNQQSHVLLAVRFWNLLPKCYQARMTDRL
jgi:hypothetical protein